MTISEVRDKRKMKQLYRIKYTRYNTDTGLKAIIDDCNIYVYCNSLFEAIEKTNSLEDTILANSSEKVEENFFHLLREKY